MRHPFKLASIVLGIAVAWQDCLGEQQASGAELVEVENKVEIAKAAGRWGSGNVGLALAVGDRVRTGELSRAAVRLTDLSMLRLDELTKIEIVPPARESAKPQLDLANGAAYFFSREKPRELEIRTPAATGALRGTEFHVRVGTGGRTQVTMFDGEVELANVSGRLLIRSGEQAEVEIGRAPRKTAVLEAVNIIQWCLYYPGVLDLRELGLTAGDERRLGASVESYRAGDLLGALEQHPGGADGGSAGARLYHAAVLLAVGQVEKAQTQLRAVPASHPGRRALEEVIAAVKFQEWARDAEPATASEWMAESYYQQSRSNLEAALKAAKKAVELSPEFGFGWARVAELEFSFGRTPRALKDVEHSLELAPRNAQAHALQGFLLAAENRIGAAQRSFDAAIRLDGALGNAWLGRGLCSIRRGDDAAGRRDLQTAAVLEPNRSILRSYLGKAFSQVGNNTKAHSELTRAKELDPNDPTPWLYSAIQNKQENRYNAAIDDLEKSIGLNDNRRVYRSQFLLDQDRSVRGTNLAAIYLNDGMTEQSVREATRAVNSDYGSAPAHLFLANSFNALRDPNRILLRYETAWFNELLLSNLLSPVGGGPLSQFVSEQEYSKLFEHDGMGISSVTDYFSYGELRETASQYGTFGNVSYALDAEYQYNNGLRPNNAISRLETYGTFKLQLGPQDTVFFQTKFARLESGDILQRYDQGEVGRETVERTTDPNTGKVTKVVHKNVVALTSDFTETEDPALLLLGLHHEWNPGTHTLLLLGRLASEQVFTVQQTSQGIVARDVTGLTSVGFLALPADLSAPISDGALIRDFKKLAGRGTIRGAFSFDQFDSDYRPNFEIWNGELNQILTLGPETFVFGGRYQSGYFETHHLFELSNSLPRDDSTRGLFLDPAEQSNTVVDFERINIYAYDIWRATRWLSITGGLTWDQLRYPENYRTPPINDRQAELDQWSPKVGFILTPTRWTTLRGAFTRGISGASFDESIRLEPTQVAGFTQAFRTLISENLIGSVAGSRYETWGLSLEQKLPTRTYLGAEYNVLKQKLDRVTGVFDRLTEDNNPGFDGVVPSGISEKDNYREDILTATINQLAGNHWAFGTGYRYTRSRLVVQRNDFRAALPSADAFAVGDLARNAETRKESGLHQLSLYALYNHPSGFFGRAEANWFSQDNDTLTPVVPVARPDGTLSGVAAARTLRHFTNSGPPGDDFWQFNLFGGYRFYRNQCELSLGLLNLTNTDYQLDPINPYSELPRGRTLLAHFKFNF